MSDGSTTYEFFKIPLECELIFEAANTTFENELFNCRDYERKERSYPVARKKGLSLTRWFPSEGQRDT
jgi:hypothetical protein